MSPLSSQQPTGFRDRVDAGARLAMPLLPRVATLAPDDIVVIGLARGGVIVAAEVARQLDVRLEAIVVRKLGAPDQRELAIGALAASGERVLNQPLINDIGLDQEQVESISSQAQKAAMSLCREIGVPAVVPDIVGKTAILVDDGLATGATMRVAIEAVYHQGARQVFVALPVAPASMVEPFREIADDVITIIAPENLRAVGQWYGYFPDVPSSAVRDALAANRASA
ncbi:MAG TPA: phosphoribosyltransferase family protein [Thermomicrobiales bacterium]|nr:phosphoribosyltransferase family protein [Thermomicrobiales bacterium]